MSCLPAARYGLLLAGLISASLFGAPPLSPADQSAIEQQQKALLEHTQQQRDILRDSAPVPSLPETTSSEEIGQCFELRHIRLENVTVLPRSAQKKLMAIPPEGCMTIRHIQQRVRDVTQDYLSRGFITSSAWLPEQDISGGNLVIAVTEGKVETVTLDGYQENALKMALPKIKGKILNLRDIEQGLEQLNRLTSRSLTVDILPGSREGFSRLELVPVSQRFPVSLDVGVDNSGQKSTGSRQINSRLTVDNLLSLADQWTLSAGRDSEFHHDRRSRSVLAGVLIPYGYWLFSAQYAWSDFYQTLSVGESPQRWRYGGSVQSQRLAASRTLLRDGKQRLALDMALSRRQTENRLGGIRLDVSSPTLSSVTAGLSYSRSIGGGYLTFGPSLSHGVSLAGATRDDPAHPDLPRSEFRRFSASTSWFYPITPSLYWLTSAYGQTTPDRLYASEQLSVGGLYSVRGFKEQYLSGNRGVYWRNELTEELMILPITGGRLSATGALDIGHVVSQRGITEGGTLTGASIGLELTGKSLSQSLTVGIPLYWPNSMTPDKHVVYWQATVSL
ncbi:ShlB/FhaC/HecB family hemolysin secretion/activation protein [Klebsiella spallanzanii]